MLECVDWTILMILQVVKFFDKTDIYLGIIKDKGVNNNNKASFVETLPLEAETANRENGRHQYYYCGSYGKVYVWY